MLKLLSRKYLSANGLLGVVHSQFKKIKPPRELAKRSKPITLTDCLMSGVAMFGLKFPSLLKFDEAKEELELKHNLRTLYHVEQAPSDTYMRERCDEVDPVEVRKVFKAVFACVQRGKGLEAFQYIDQHYLLAGDGTGFFSSDVVHCKNCCVKHYNQCHVKIQGHIPDNLSEYKKNTYVLVKNSKQPWELYCIDHERKITKLEPFTVDGLQAILMDKSRSNLSKDDKEQINAFIKTAECIEYMHQTKDGTTHRYRYINQVQLNKSHETFKTNFIEYWETNKKGEKQHFCWVTDITITNDNVYQIMRGGRINWRIENNTFNTLKNQGYHFSHNFGHGYANLCSVFGVLMMLAFLIDQVQELCCQLWKAARAKFKSRTSLWEKMRGMFKEYLIDSWDDLFNAIAYGRQKPTKLVPNTG